MASTVTVERNSRSLVDALRYNYPSRQQASKLVPRRDSKTTREIKYQVRVHWQDHGVYVFDIKNTMLVADLKAMVEAKTGVPGVRQRLTFDGEVLRASKTFDELPLSGDGMLRPSALWTQIELTHLSGLCLPDSNTDFWVKTSGSVSEQLVPVHGRSKTSLRDLGMLLFERHGNLPRGRRQLVWRGQVVYDSHAGGTRLVNGESVRTLGDIGLKKGAVLEFQMLILPT